MSQIAGSTESLATLYRPKRQKSSVSASVATQAAVTDLLLRFNLKPVHVRFVLN